MNYQQNYQKWITAPALDEASRAEISALDEQEKEFRFYAPLAFGTAGLRGKMGAGLNAMNVYTVAWATQGLARFLLEQGPAEPCVVIGRDSRNHSLDFARTAAQVLAANGIRVLFFDDIRPTPVLSFAVRRLRAAGGINVTASHNPKEYNGYKVYWSDGAQISLEQAERISEILSGIDLFDDVRQCDFEQALSDGRIRMIGAEVDEAYLEAVQREQVNPQAVRDAADTLKIVYTPLHGTGYRLVPEILCRIGLKHIYPVEEQMRPDGDFPTAPFPNPELPEVFALGLQKADEFGSDLIIANDPDADRLGIMARGKDGFEVLTGNQTGALLLDYIITSLAGQGRMPDRPYAVKTIVTSELAAAICASGGVTLYNVLTGFKFIGEVIGEHERTGDGSFLFGYEESYGYLKGTHARDKDAVVASMLVAEMAAYYHAKGMTLCDALDALYARFGQYREQTVNVYMEGLDGIARMKALMERLRGAPPADFDGQRVVEVRDYLAGTVTDVATGAQSPTGLPTSDVLYYKTDRDNVVVIRPSGTEPKVKVYLLLHADTAAQAEQMIAKFRGIVDSWTAQPADAAAK